MTNMAWSVATSQNNYVVGTISNDKHHSKHSLD